MTRPSPTVQTAVRLPRALHKELATIANRDERSLNTTMVRALREYAEAHR
jgi:predicted HicB family RNase H-like nuclease